jgi:hypothetical protein
MKAINFEEPVPYVCEEERALPIEDQTVFHIKPKTHKEANRTVALYAGAGRDGRKGYRELNKSKLDSADFTEWENTVVKIENFSFPDDFYTEHDEVKKQAKKRKDGLYVLSIEDIWLRKEVLRYLPADVVNEIWDVAVDYSKLKEGEKKS